jgi:site-specific recombinase XerC
MIKVSTTGMAVSLKTDLRFPISGQWGHGDRIIHATQLLEENVDIRYIQTMLGHSSINVTEIYTHVTISKQKDILASKHPRRNMNISN